ncbi:MAG: hypothetical protein ACLQF4_03980 [Xanthobacteraceae bacterium]
MRKKIRTVEEVRASQKEQAEKDTALVKARPASVLSADLLNPWIEVGAELDRFILAPLLKFTKTGEFAVSDVESIPVGVRCIAHADEITLGWQKWVEGKPGDQRVGRIADRFVPPKRSELDDNDAKLWPLQDDGTRRDPWQFTMACPLTRLDTPGKETFRFTTSSKGGLACISKLVNAYGVRIHQAEAGLPIVELKSDFYKHRVYGKIFTPSMIVVGWTDEGGKPLSLAEDLNDEIGI